MTIESLLLSSEGALPIGDAAAFFIEVRQPTAPIISKVASALVKVAKEPATDAELKEVGRQRAVTSIAADHERELARRGERIGKTVGSVAGLIGGGAAGKKVVKGSLGTLGGAALGAVLGRGLGGEVGAEVDIHRGNVKTAAASMAAWAKTANSATLEAAMSTPGASANKDPSTYMQAERLGRDLQYSREVEYLKGLVSGIQQQAQQAIQQTTEQAQQYAEAATIQAQQAQAEAASVLQVAQETEAKVQQALGQALSAKDEALRQTETAARTQMANQDLRMKLMQLASTEPDMQAALALAQTTQPPPPPQPSEVILDAKAAKEVDEANRAKTQAEVQSAQAAESVDKGASADLAKVAGFAGAALGSVYGATSYLLDAQRRISGGVPRLVERVNQLEQEQDGSFSRAAALARAKHAVIDTELQTAYPLRTLPGQALKAARDMGVTFSKVEDIARGKHKGINMVNKLYEAKKRGLI